MSVGELSCLGQGGGDPGECLGSPAVVGDGAGDAFGIGDLAGGGQGGGDGVKASACRQPSVMVRARRSASAIFPAVARAAVTAVKASACRQSSVMVRAMRSASVMLPAVARAAVTAVNASACR